MTSNGVSGGGSSSKGRGVLWRLQETLHLLDIWGEQNMQDQLRNTYQNLECFEYIAQEMARRGYRRTAVECRSKAKALRLAYKRVIDHNSKEGNSKMTCPFYDQLHQILRGDASAKSKWVPQRLSFQDGSQQEAALGPPQAVEEDVMSHDFPVIDDDGQYIKQEEAGAHFTLTRPLAEIYPHAWHMNAEATIGTDNGIEEMKEMGGETVPQGKEESSNESWGRNLDSQRTQVSPEEQDSFSCVDPAEANSPLSPSPTPMVRPRKKKKADVMFEQFLQQSREQHKELLLEMARDREVALDFLKSFKEDAAEHREESEQLTETMYTQNETLKGLVANLNSLIDAFVNQSQNRHCSHTSHSTTMQ